MELRRNVAQRIPLLTLFEARRRRKWHPRLAILRFLGHEPWPLPVTLGDHLMAERRRRGLAIDKAAALIGIDEGTLRRWERGEWKPTERTKPILDGFLGIPGQAALPDAS